MIGKILLLLVIAGAVLLVVGREILVLGAERRADSDPAPLYRRFRRRAKGAILLGSAAGSATFHREIAERLGLIPSEHLMLLGLLLIVVIWAMILAGRDLHETTLGHVERGREIRLRAIQDMEEILKNRNRPPD